MYQQRAAYRVDPGWPPELADGFDYLESQGLEYGRLFALSQRLKLEEADFSESTLEPLTDVERQFWRAKSAQWDPNGSNEAKTSFLSELYAAGVSNGPPQHLAGQLAQILREGEYQLYLDVTADAVPKPRGPVPELGRAPSRRPRTPS